MRKKKKQVKVYLSKVYLTPTSKIKFTKALKAKNNKKLGVIEVDNYKYLFLI